MKIRIYNVKHGNMVTIHQMIGGVEKTILFDCGTDSDFTGSEVEGMQSYINQNIVPNTIIVSHNHIDHCKFCCAANCDHLEHIIVNEEPTKRTAWKSFFAKEKLKGRTIIDLSRDKTLVGKTLKDKNYKLDYDNITLYLGTNSNRRYVNNLNDRGIILCIETPNGKMVLPGDCSYYSWPSIINLFDLNYLLIPHHGLKIDALWPNPPKVPRLTTEVYVSAEDTRIEDYHKKVLERVYYPATSYNYTNGNNHQVLYYYEIDL